MARPKTTKTTLKTIDGINRTLNSLSQEEWTELWDGVAADLAKLREERGGKGIFEQEYENDMKRGEQYIVVSTEERPPIERWYALVSDHGEFHEAKPAEYLRQMEEDIYERNQKVFERTGRTNFWKIIAVDVQLPYYRDRLGD